MRPILVVLSLTFLVGCSVGPGAPSSSAPPRVAATDGRVLVPYTVNRKIAVTIVENGKTHTVFKPVVETRYKDAMGVVNVTKDLKHYRFFDTEGQPLSADEVGQRLRTSTPVLLCRTLDPYYLRAVRPGTIVVVGDTSVVEKKADQGNEALRNGP